MTDARRALPSADPSPDPLAALAAKVARVVVVDWTPWLRMRARRRPRRRADLERRPGAVVRVLDVRHERVERTYGPDGETAPHSLALVIVEGEESPRWIAAERVGEVVR